MICVVELTRYIYEQYKNEKIKKVGCIRSYIGREWRDKGRSSWQKKRPQRREYEVRYRRSSQCGKKYFV